MAKLATSRLARSMQPPAGVTLLELLVTLAVAAVLIVMGVPAYQAMIARMELRDRVHALVSGMQLARAESIKRDVRVNLCQSGDGVHCAGTGGWETGWLIYADSNLNGERDTDEDLIRVEGPSWPGITVRGNKPVAEYVSFTSFGQTRMLNGALQMGTFTVCRSGQNAVDVVLANGGRVRVNETKLPCP